MMDNFSRGDGRSGMGYMLFNNTVSAITRQHGKPMENALFFSMDDGFCPGTNFPEGDFLGLTIRRETFIKPESIEIG
jgi:hypothetical protein